MPSVAYHCGGQAPNETALEDQKQEQGRQDDDCHPGKGQALVCRIQRLEPGQGQLHGESTRLLD